MTVAHQTTGRRDSTFSFVLRRAVDRAGRRSTIIKEQIVPNSFFEARVIKKVELSCTGDVVSAASSVV